MKLFEVPKVGLFLDNITHGTEARDGDEVKVVTLTLRAAPLTAQLASALPPGVRMSLFKSTEGAEPRPHLRRVEFDLGVPRQLLDVYATRDSGAATIAFDQVKIASVLARVDKNVNGWALIVKASFGPLDKTELEYIEEWRLGQRWVTFSEAEPGLFDDAPGATVVDDEEDVNLPLH